MKWAQLPLTNLTSVESGNDERLDGRGSWLRVANARCGILSCDSICVTENGMLSQYPLGEWLLLRLFPKEEQIACTFSIGASKRTNMVFHIPH